MKKCKHCQKEKPLDQFFRDSTTKDGRQGKCKECKAATRHLTGLMRI